MRYLIVLIGFLELCAVSYGKITFKLSYYMILCGFKHIHIFKGSFKTNSFKQEPCYEQPFCSLINVTTLLEHCRVFFKISCPLSCGMCASIRRTFDYVLQSFIEIKFN